MLPDRPQEHARPASSLSLLVSLREAERLTGLSRRTLGREFVETGRVRLVAVGTRGRRFVREELEAEIAKYVAERRVVAATAARSAVAPGLHS